MSKIIKRVYYAVEIELASPLCVSNGTGAETDADLIRTSDGSVFIPGTSIAGALRSNMDAADRDMIAGFSDGNLGRMSKLYLSDLCFFEGVESIRDGVKLTSDKNVENKFDFEVLETGARGTMYISYLIREGDAESLFQRNIVCILNGIADGQIRFGANKNRGYGRLAVKTVRMKTFDRSNRNDYISFDVRDLSKYEGPETYDEWSRENSEKNDRYCKVAVPLRLTGGISIRKYSARPNEADYMQITIGKEDAGNERPVIPGTSWNGAIRSDALRILKELEVDDAEQYINQWFGHVNQKDPEGRTARQSAVVIGESIIKDSVPLTMTRNKVNRFDASTQDGALYTEISYFGGTTDLEIMVKKSIEYIDDTNKKRKTALKDVNYKAILGLVMLVITDIVNGYVAIGGQTAVGRGLFEGNGEIRISEAGLTEAECRRALYQYLQEVRRCR